VAGVLAASANPIGPKTRNALKMIRDFMIPPSVVMIQYRKKGILARDLGLRAMPSSIVKPGRRGGGEHDV
jgi:hypothetical protein